MICFENEGLLDLDFIRLFGASVKETHNPIGFFGTGLKFAIAVLLRNNCEIVLFRGLEKYEFKSKAVDLRGSEFSVVLMNEEQLGFTTQLGKNWKLWMAYRELYCNMMDEAGYCSKDISDNAEMVGREGATKIYVKGLDEVASNHHLYFVVGEPNTISSGVEIHNKPTESIFYRGVKVLEKETANTYNIENTVELTEDRTLKWNYEYKENILKSLLQCTDETIIRNALLAPKGVLEYEFDYSSYSSCEPSPQFMKVVIELNGRGNKSAFLIWKRTQKLEGVEISSVQTEKLLKAYELLESMDIGFDRNKYEIIFVTGFGDPHQLGEAIDGKMVISKEAFDSDFAATLLEEYIHLEKGYSDCSRELQTWLFRLCIRLTEELKQEKLNG